MGFKVDKFNDDSENNLGYSDWYIPACGQLALMYLNRADINAVFTKIGGTTFAESGYCSSTEFSADEGYYVHWGNNGTVGHDIHSKDLTNKDKVCFIRDIK